MLARKMPLRWYQERRRMVEESDAKHRRIMKELQAEAAKKDPTIMVPPPVKNNKTDEQK